MRWLRPATARVAGPRAHVNVGVVAGGLAHRRGRAAASEMVQPPSLHIVLGSLLGMPPSTMHFEKTSLCNRQRRGECAADSEKEKI